MRASGVRGIPSRAARPSTIRMLARGVTKRCARCGAGRLFTRWLRIRDRCPRCGLEFERRGEGFFLGGMAINLGVTEALFGAFLLIAAILTWPDVPWTGILIASLFLNGLFPVFFYPFSKTIFIAIDLALHEADPPRRNGTAP